MFPQWKIKKGTHGDDQSAEMYSQETRKNERQFVLW